MLGLEPSAERRGGSTPSIPTNHFLALNYNQDHQGLLQHEKSKSPFK